MRKRKTRLLLCVLTVIVMISAFSLPVFAQAEPDEEDPIPETEESTQPPETVPPETVPPETIPPETSEITTQALLYCRETHKQFIEIQDRDGNTFYIVIDYDAPINEKEELYKTYFLNAVDAEDLSALAEGGKLPTCSCREKCLPGKINLNCPVCASNMSECMGREPAPQKDPEPTQPTTPEKESGMNPMVIVILLAGLGGGAFYLFQQKKAKAQPPAANPDDYDEDSEEPWETEEYDLEEDAESEDALE